jgi:hypothetical protein
MTFFAPGYEAQGTYKLLEDGQLTVEARGPFTGTYDTHINGDTLTARPVREGQSAIFTFTRVEKE